MFLVLRKAYPLNWSNPPPPPQKKKKKDCCGQVSEKITVPVVKHRQPCFHPPKSSRDHVNMKESILGWAVACCWLRRRALGSKARICRVFLQACHQPASCSHCCHTSCKHHDAFLESTLLEQHDLSNASGNCIFPQATHRCGLGLWKGACSVRQVPMVQEVEKKIQARARAST